MYTMAKLEAVNADSEENQKGYAKKGKGKGKGKSSLNIKHPTTEKPSPRIPKSDHDDDEEDPKIPESPQFSQPKVAVDLDSQLKPMKRQRSVSFVGDVRDTLPSFSTEMQDRADVKLTPDESMDELRPADGAIIASTPIKPSLYDKMAPSADIGPEHLPCTPIPKLPEAAQMETVIVNDSLECEPLSESLLDHDPCSPSRSDPLKDGDDDDDDDDDDIIPPTPGTSQRSNLRTPSSQYNLADSTKCLRRILLSTQLKVISSVCVCYSKIIQFLKTFMEFIKSIFHLRIS